MLRIKSLHSLQLKRLFSQPVYSTHPHLLNKNEITPGISKDEYKKRRYNFVNKIIEHQKMKKKQSDHKNLILFMSSPKIYMAHDVPYPFRQNSDFSYLCGLLEIDSILAIEALTDYNQDFVTTIFAPNKDPHKEMWDGSSASPAQIIELTGVDNSLEIAHFNDFLNLNMSKLSKVSLWYDRLEPVNLSYHNKYIQNNLKNYCEVDSPRYLLQSVRLYKSDAEIKLLKQACDISSEAFKEIIKFSKPDIDEAHLYARMDYESRIRGAERLAYPPVIAGGKRSNIIHYLDNNQLVRDGELVLVDAGCEYHGYCSDITRTWPVNGKFSQCQLELYEALLEVQIGCISLCRPREFSLNDIYMQMLDLLGRQLSRVFPQFNKASSTLIQSIARGFCPHHVGHYLGMDVHDVDQMSRTIPLQPGFVITIEPGIYINDTMKILSKEWHNIGIRIEDDILITGSQPVVLSKQTPKTTKDLIKLLNE